jgi:cytochrome c oxidase subunit 2
MNQGASNFVQSTDLAFAVILGMSLFFLLAITFFMIYFVIKYNKKKNPRAADVKDDKRLEITWIVVPTVLVLVMFYYGWVGYQPMRNIPEDAIKVKATGRMWSFSFDYPNGKTSAELVVPVGKAVALDLFSPDVIHSLYIPAFRIKEDMVPGVNNKMWFQANELGEYDILCAEYCGERHSYMLSKVKVLSEEEYQKWLETNTNADGTVMSTGENLLTKNGCFACHSRDGSKIVGPSFKGLFGSGRSVFDADGKLKEITADAEYIKRAVYEPNAEVVQGYNKGLMISYKQTVSEDDIVEMVKYLESLK